MIRKVNPHSSTLCPAMASSSIRKNNFEVFLSFRGEDTRYTFTDRLFENLGRMGIHTFRDDQLERGEEIKSELLKIIEDSRISIVVFSKSYAHSKWCLDELAKIMECREEMDQIVLPVFYHVDPSDVRNQTGSFREAFSVHEGNVVDEKKMKMWRDSLTEASNLGGFHVNDGYESRHIKEIINEVSKRLNPKLLNIDDNMVGIDRCLEKLNSLLISHLNVCVVGIYGTGGIGKTTIAKILYNTIQCQFTGASFLEDVREKCKKGHQLQLQQQLLGNMVGYDIQLRDINEGINMIKGRFSSKKVLIVIDDVDQLKQFKFLVGNREWFGLGSRIIITTRDQHLLAEYGVDISYNVEQLRDDEALQLFSQHAFKQSVPKEGYADLSNCMIKYAQGLPLALKVLGSYLHSMTVDEWKSALGKLKKKLKPEIDHVLRISYDGLDQYEKEVFLDIACFFKGECKDVVLRILDGCDLFATCGIRVLQDRCLVTISHNCVHMHDLIQQMGWEVVRGEYRGDPSKWSRLWDADDIYDAFSRQEGMENIQTISLHLSELKEIQFLTKVFAKMKKLRLLKIYCDDHDDFMRNEYKVLLPKDFEFPRNLRYLNWQGCNLRSLPSKFCGENIMEIKLKSSNLKQLWKGNQRLGKLRALDLNNSKQLVKMPKFSSMPNLERLNLEGCTNLRELDSSIGDLKRLVYLNLERCEQLRTFPSGKKFESLEVLYLNRCPNLKKFPEINGSMKHLTRLDFSMSGIKELSSSIMYLDSLEVLDLRRCSNLEKFPEIHREMKFMRTLDLSGCSKFEKFPDIFSYMRRLSVLHLQRSGIKDLPESIGDLECLISLELIGCSKFEKLPEIRGKNMKCLHYLSLDETAIKELPDSIGSLTSLITLSLAKCSRFEKFSDIFANMRLLRKLILNESGVKELPNSIGCLRALETLDLHDCSKFEKFPEIQGNMKCLKTLNLERTAVEELPNGIGCLQTLEFLSLEGCSKFERLPEFKKDMKNLSHLSLKGTAIKELPYSIGQLTGIKELNLDYCRNLRSLPNSVTELLKRLESNKRRLSLSHSSELKRISQRLSRYSELKRLKRIHEIVQL